MEQKKSNVLNAYSVISDLVKIVKVQIALFSSFVKESFFDLILE